MAIPSVTVEVAFDGGPFSTSYTWTDVTNWVQALKVKRGRSYELDRIETGTLSLTLDNADGRFTPGRDTINELLPDNVRTGSDTLGTTSGFNTNSPVTMSSGTSNPHSGSRAIQILAASITSGTAILFTNRINVVAGKTYQGSFWVRKTTTAGNADVPMVGLIRWRDSAGNLISDSYGTTIDGTSSSWVKCTAVGVAPANAATGIVIAQTTAAVASSWVYWLDDFSLAEVNPYYPNLVPRRRIRVRTSNLMPKDTATGADVTRISANAFSTYTTGTTKNFSTATAKSGAGSVFVQCGSNGTANYASSVMCGYVSTVSSGWFWWQTLTNVPNGLARVVAGQPYSIAAQVWLKTGSPATSVVGRIVWYDASLTQIGSSASSSALALTSGAWVQLTNSNQTAPTGAVWAGIEIGTTGGDNATGFYVDELQLEAGTSVSAWTPGGAVFYGYVEQWSVQLDSLVPQCAVSANDGFSVLGTTELHTPYQQAIVTSNPLGYWPLTDAAGSTTVANLDDDTLAGALVASKYGGATAAFGATSVLAKETGLTSYSLTNISSTQGTVIDLNAGGTRTYPLGSDFSVAFWALPVRPSSGYVTLFAGWDDAGQQLLTVRYASDGTVQVNVTYASGEQQTYDTLSILTLSTSVASFIAVTITGGSFTLYVNGALAFGYPNSPAANSDLRDLKWSSLAGQQAPARSTWAEYANGTYGHVAIWNRAISANEVADFWKIGGRGTTPYTESEDSRISRLASYANFQGDLLLDSGLSTVTHPVWDEGTTALEVVQGTAEDASGYVFMDGDGRLTYHNRARRQSAPVRFTLGESSGLPFEPGLTFTMDDDKVINEVTYSRTGGTSGTVRSASSIAAYGRKSKSLDLSLTTDSAVMNAAYALLNVYDAPIVRCDQVSIKPTATDALFPVALGVEIGDRIRLTDLAATAPASSYEFYVEAIDTDVSTDGQTATWVATLSLSPAVATDVWVLEDSTNGILNSTTVLAY